MSIEDKIMAGVGLIFLSAFGFFIAGAWATGHTSSACVGTGVSLILCGMLCVIFFCLTSGEEN